MTLIETYMPKVHGFALGGYFGQVLQALLASHQRRVTKAAFEKVSDQTLRDIGVARDVLHMSDF